MVEGLGVNHTMFPDKAPEILYFVGTRRFFCFDDPYIFQKLFGILGY
jgi:hypothetical protein